MRNRQPPNRPQVAKKAGGGMEDMVQKARKEASGKAMKTGGIVKKAAGGVGKIRHEQATKAGKPLSRAEYDKKRI